MTLISEKVSTLYSFKHDMQPRNESLNRHFIHGTQQLSSIIVNKSLLVMLHNHILVNKSKGTKPKCLACFCFVCFCLKNKDFPITLTFEILYCSMCFKIMEVFQ